MNKVYVDTNIALGNHMFQYAVCRSIAEINGYNFYIPYGGYLSKCFPNLELGESDGDIKFLYQDDNSSQKYNSEVFSVPDFTNLHGFFQTEKYFETNEEKVKNWFKVEIDESTQDILLKYPVDKYCYIHIRGGDYKDSSNWLLPKDYYVKSMTKIKELGCNKFVIVTDDFEYSKSIFEDIDVISNDVVTDFKSLYYSKYCIMSNSTFSWWACWLSEKKISIAPMNWLNYNNPELGFFPSDIKSNKFDYL